jgi:acyl dehydratase
VNVKVGDRIPEWVMERVSPERMRTMAAILRDPNPLHWDREIVERLGLGKRTINQGPLGVSYMVNMLQAWAGENCIRRIVVRFPNPVILDEDRIVACGTVTGLSEEDGIRLAECDIWLERDGEAGLIEGTATVRLA